MAKKKITKDKKQTIIYFKHLSFWHVDAFAWQGLHVEIKKSGNKTLLNYIESMIKTKEAVYLSG
jgi:hypothetical protein